jgi:methionine-rich copper-binding protein CopC
MKSKYSILAAGILIALGATTDRLHFELSRSVPEADAIVTSAPEIRLWFTEAAQENSVGIRLLTADSTTVATAPPARDRNDARIYSVAVPAPLPGGRYTVAWRGIGDDGHVVTGSFAFTVRPAE